MAAFGLSISTNEVEQTNSDKDSGRGSRVGLVSKGWGWDQVIVAQRRAKIVSDSL